MDLYEETLDEEFDSLCDGGFREECESESTVPIGSFRVEGFPVEASAFARGDRLHDSDDLSIVEALPTPLACSSSILDDAYPYEEKRPGRSTLRERLGRFQTHLRSRSLEKKRTRSARRSTRFWAKSRRRPSRFSALREPRVYRDLSIIANETELGDFCRRIRQNDPTPEQVHIDGDLARSNAIELNEAMVSSSDDWRLKPVWDTSTGRSEKPSYVMFRPTGKH